MSTGTIWEDYLGSVAGDRDAVSLYTAGLREKESDDPEIREQIELLETSLHHEPKWYREDPIRGLKY